MRVAWKYRWLICGLYAAGLLAVSVIPARTMAAAPELFRHQDKLAHALLYGGWAVLLGWALRAHGRRSPGAWLAGAVGIAAAYGALMEGLQGMLLASQRSCSAGDLLANLAGAGLAVGFHAWLRGRPRDRFSSCAS